MEDDIKITSTWQPCRELIDFRCSDVFLDFYHDLGLTPRHSGETRAPRVYEVSGDKEDS